MRIAANLAANAIGSFVMTVNTDPSINAMNPTRNITDQLDVSKPVPAIMKNPATPVAIEIIQKILLIKDVDSFTITSILPYSCTFDSDMFYLHIT